MIRLNKSVGLTTEFCPLIVIDLTLAPITLTLSLRWSVTSVNVLPVIWDAAAWPIDTASSQFTDPSATMPVDRDTRLSCIYPANGECACSHCTNMSRSLLSLDWVLGRRSFICCSEVTLCTPVNCSSALQIGRQRGSAWTHFVSVLSVIPRPWVIPPEVLSIRIKTCSIVWSEKLPLQKSSRRRIVK